MPTCAVCVRFCVDVAELRADDATGAPLLDGAPLRISTLDEYAVEAAVRTKEAHGGSVTAVSWVAKEPPRELLLRLLAMGVDHAQVIVDETLEDGDALATATLLAASLRALGPFDLIFAGEGSIDRFDQQVGPRVAELLGLPSVTYATRVELDGSFLSADRLLEDRVDTVRCPLPALVTVGQEAAVPRMPSVLQTLAAGRKPVVVQRTTERAAVGLAGSRTLNLRAPQSARKRTRVSGDDSDEIAMRLAQLLATDGVVRST